MRVKICGLTDAAAVEKAAALGADYVGLNFFPASPRAIGIEAAAEASAALPPGVTRVALVVDPDDILLARIVRDVGVDMIQLHGHETPERVTEVRKRHGLPVMKAIGIRDASDLEQIPAYEAVADQIMVDAKPPKGAALPGGNGLQFDHRLIAGRSWSVPWMLAGGLTPETVADAIRLTGAEQVDVSSGVEAVPGVKDMAKVRAFIEAARQAAGP